MAPKRPPPCRIFLSRTSDLAHDHEGGSFVAAAHSAVARAGHALTDMHHFTASAHPPPQVCAEKVREADMFVLLAGFRYGSLVCADPPLSYCEFEHRVAVTARKPRLAFLLGEGVRPAGAVSPTDDGARQQDFRERLRRDGVVATFTSPDNLEMLIYQALQESYPNGCGDRGWNPTMNVFVRPAEGAVDGGNRFGQNHPNRAEHQEFDASKFHR